MGVVNTTYTFSGTDTITSAKLNNIIDDTTFTSDAIQGTTLQVVSPGKLAVSAGGITSNELASNSVVTAKIADSNVTTVKIADANITQAKVASGVATTGPAFFAYLNTNQPCPNDGSTRVIQISVENFDTNSCFNTSNYRFTPNVAGYYQINLSANIDDATVGDFGDILFAIRKNGTIFHNTGVIRIAAGSAEFAMSGSVLIQMNGTSDYIEAVAIHGFGTAGSAILVGGSNRTYMSGFLARSA
jgi:hypothetical protein